MDTSIWKQRFCTLSEYSFDCILLWIAGFLSPMLLIYIAGNSVLIYTLLLCVAWCLLLVLANNGEVRFITEHRWPVVFSILSLISIGVCARSTLDDIWKSGLVTQILWIVLYLIFFMFYSLPQNREYAVFYIKGVYASSVVQAFWCIGQYITYKFTEKSLNEIFFRDALHIECPEGYSQYREGSICLTGVCWHASNMAPLLVIGYCFSRNILLKGMMVVVALLSGSRTAILGIAVCVVVDILINFKKLFGIIKVNPVVFAVVFVILIIAAIYFFVINTSVKERVIELIGKYLNNNASNDTSTNAHTRYWTETPKALKETPLINILFGYGPGNSGYMGSTYLGMYPGSKWVLECDYMDCLWSYGVLGMLARYTFYIGGAIKVVRKEIRLLPLVLSFAVMGVTYNVIYTWGILFIYCLIIYWGMQRDEEHTCRYP